jgi:nucleoside-diphosphate-sugar epimerase
MKIVVIGGTGLIGSKTVERLRKKGHEVLAASPNWASIPLQARASTRPWPEQRSSSIWPIRHRSRTRQ